VWWDREIRAGADFAVEIDREIAAAHAVVVLWSDASQHSPWVRDEGAYARDRQKLVPICLDDAEPPLGFRQVQSLRLRKGSDHADIMSELVSAVRGLVSGEVPARSVPQPSRAPRRKRALIAVAAAFVALLLTGLLVRTQVPDDAASPKSEAAPFAMAPHVVTDSEKSIAVLPFADMSEKRDQEFLADGMTEEIINLLANAPDLLVSARTSSFYFKGKATKLEEIGRELGVVHILEGSIRRFGDRLRVTAQLVRADDGFHLCRCAGAADPPEGRRTEPTQGRYAEPRGVRVPAQGVQRRLREHGYVLR
jgi:adenylate cyclase